MLSFKKLISKVSKGNYKTQEDLVEKLEEVRESLNGLIDNIQPPRDFPRADELALIKYHNRFKTIMDIIVTRASRGLDYYRFYLTPGHPPSERIHDCELSQLKELGYKTKVTIDSEGNYEMIVSWSFN